MDARKSRQIRYYATIQNVVSPLLAVVFLAFLLSGFAMTADSLTAVVGILAIVALREHFRLKRLFVAVQVTQEENEKSLNDLRGLVDFLISKERSRMTEAMSRGHLSANEYCKISESLDRVQDTYGPTAWRA